MSKTPVTERGIAAEHAPALDPTASAEGRRAALFDRIDARCETMFANGAIEEVAVEGADGKMRRTFCRPGTVEAAGISRRHFRQKLPRRMNEKRRSFMK